MASHCSQDSSSEGANTGPPLAEPPRGFAQGGGGQPLCLVMDSERSFFCSGMLFDDPEHRYLLRFRLPLSAASVVLLAVRAGVGVSRERRPHSVCPQGPSLCCVWSRGPLWGERRGRIAVLIACSAGPSLPLFSKDGSLLPQLVVEIIRLREWSRSSVLSEPDA